MITKAHARALRQMIERLAQGLPDAEAIDVQELFPKWSDDHYYEVDDRVRYGDTLYKCLTSHNSQATWTPEDSPSLWAWVDDPSVEFPPWKQPLDATTAYRIGAKVSHKGKHWINLTIDYNVYEPSVYGWSEV